MSKLVLFALSSVSFVVLVSTTVHAAPGRIKKDRFTPREQEQMEDALDRQRCRESGYCRRESSTRRWPKSSGSTGNRFTPREREQMERALNRLR